MASLDEVFRTAAPWRRRLSVEARGPQPGSILAGDDRATNPHHLSHSAYSALEAAVDHLTALERLVRHSEAIDRRPPFTVVRPAIECSAAAVWLMAPGLRNTRVLRLLRHRWADMRAGEEVRELIGQPAPRSLDVRKRELQELAWRRGLTQQEVSTVASNTIGYETIVETAGAEATTPGLSADKAKLAWKVCSGMSHGKVWAALGVLERRDTRSVGGNVMQAGLQVPLSTLAGVATVAALLTREGWRLYDRGCEPPM
jgi:hypothetical protein